jgi:hypothetical protein
MKITENQILSRKVAGHTKEGEPIVYVVTKGGLHAFFKRAEDGNIETLAAAPHKAIGKWLTEQKSKGLTWNETDLDKSEDDLFDKLRRMLFAKLDQPIPNPDEWQILYNPIEKKIGLVQKSDLPELIKSDLSLKYAWIRDISLEKPFQLLESTEEYNLTSRKGS